MNAVLYGHSFRLPSQLTPSAHPLSEYVMNDVSSPDRNVRLLARSLASCTKRRRRWKKTKIYRANVKMRVRGAVAQRSMHPLVPSSPLLALDITTVFGFLVRYGRSRKEREVQARPNFGTAGETSSHFDRLFLHVGVLLLSIILIAFPIHK